MPAHKLMQTCHVLLHWRLFTHKNVPCKGLFLPSCSIRI